MHLHNRLTIVSKYRDFGASRSLDTTIVDRIRRLGNTMHLHNRLTIVSKYRDFGASRLIQP